ncbi:hypothetical protein [Agromyces sp. H66]|uniref:hypothetical protein n=1 Tax=Agromyces sp. H66 TaxID=2529859 RepID=UPI00145AFCA4|nr:hypothetical protein [Agromyces sp. H66]
MTELVALGTRVPLLVEAIDEAMLRDLLDPWRDADAPDASMPAADPVQLGTVTAETFDRDASRLTTLVTLAGLGRLRGLRLLLHAGGVADADGRVHVYVGPSGSGKTTASRALGARRGYVSDESIAIDEGGCIAPYRKPLSVIVDGSHHKQQWAPSALGLRPLPDAPLVLGSLLLLDRHPPAGDGDVPPASVTAVPLCEALLELASQSSYLTEMHEPLQSVARLVDRIGPVQRVSYTEARTLPDAIDQLNSSAHPEPKPWRSVLPTARAANAYFAPVEVCDAIESEGSACVLLPSGVLQLLAGVGPTLWRAVCAGLDLDAIIVEVEREHGTPPDGTLHERVLQELAEMQRAGLIAPTAVADRIKTP